MPQGSRASMTALAVAGVEPMVAASPMPLAPSMLIGVLVVVWWVSKVGKSCGPGHGVVVEGACEKFTAAVVGQLFDKGLADALSEATVNLPCHQQRGDDHAAVVD